MWLESATISLVESERSAAICLQWQQYNLFEHLFYLELIAASSWPSCSQPRCQAAWSQSWTFLLVWSSELTEMTKWLHYSRTSFIGFGFVNVSSLSNTGSGTEPYTTLPVLRTYLCAGLCHLTDDHSFDLVVMSNNTRSSSVQNGKVWWHIGHARESISMELITRGSDKCKLHRTVHTEPKNMPI